MDQHFNLHFAPTCIIPAQNTIPTVHLQPEEIVDRVLKAAESGATEPALMIDLQKSWKNRNATAFKRKSLSYCKIECISFLFTQQPSNSGSRSNER